jgi:hypothetical protein
MLGRDGILKPLRILSNQRFSKTKLVKTFEEGKYPYSEGYYNTSFWFDKGWGAKKMNLLSPWNVLWRAES